MKRLLFGLLTAALMAAGGCAQQKYSGDRPWEPRGCNVSGVGGCGKGCGGRCQQQPAPPPPPQVITIEKPCDNPVSTSIKLPELAGTITRTNTVWVDSKLYYCKPDGTMILLDQATGAPQVIETAVKVTSDGSGVVSTNITTTKGEPCKTPPAPTDPPKKD